MNYFAVRTHNRQRDHVLRVILPLGHFTQVVTVGKVKCMTTVVTPEHATMMAPSQDLGNRSDGSNRVIGAGGWSGATQI